jgi:hypothetical protein
MGVTLGGVEALVETCTPSTTVSRDADVMHGPSCLLTCSFRRSDYSGRCWSASFPMGATAQQVSTRV